MHPKYDVTSFYTVNLNLDEYLSLSENSGVRETERERDSNVSRREGDFSDSKSKSMRERALKSPSRKRQVKVGLYVHKLHRISLSVLVSLSSLSSSHCVNSLRHSTMARLYDLSSDIAERVAEREKERERERERARSRPVRTLSNMSVGSEKTPPGSPMMGPSSSTGLPKLSLSSSLSLSLSRARRRAREREGERKGEGEGERGDAGAFGWGEGYP
jgi:hypothetical protein